MRPPYILDERVCRPTRGGDTVGHPSMDVVSWLRKELEAADGDLLREMVQAMAEVLMSAEVRAHCNACYGECSPERLNVHNGYRPPCWDRRVGTIDLVIPKLRRGSYYPTGSWIRHGRPNGPWSPW